MLDYNQVQVQTDISRGPHRNIYGGGGVQYTYLIAYGHPLSICLSCSCILCCQIIDYELPKTDLLSRKGTIDDLSEL